MTEVFEEPMDAFITWYEIDEAMTTFWSKNELSIDKNGKSYRTDIPRKRPSSMAFGDHNFLFKKKGVKVQVDNEETSH